MSSVVVDRVLNINDTKQSWKIVVKIIRMWTARRFHGCRAPHAVDMVLMDDQGTKIHANIRKTLVYKFARMLSEGRVYCLTYLGVEMNSGEFRTTKHVFKLKFLFNTEVQAVSETPITIEPYSFVPFPELLSDVHDNNYLVDIIGVLSGVGTERLYEKGHVLIKMMLIEIEAYGVKVERALFGSYVDQVAAHLGGTQIVNSVVLMQFVKVKKFRGDVCLRNMHGATRIVFNPQIQEAYGVKQRYT